MRRGVDVIDIFVEVIHDENFENVGSLYFILPQDSDIHLFTLQTETFKNGEPVANILEHDGCRRVHLGGAILFGRVQGSAI